MRWTRAASARKGLLQGGQRIEPTPVSDERRVTDDVACVRLNRVVLAVVATAKPCEDAFGPTGVRSIVNSQA